MTIFQRLKTYLRFFRRPWGVAVGLGAVLLLIIVFSSGGNAEARVPIKVAYGTVSQGVSVTGKATPLEKVNLAFERGGVVSEVVAIVGEEVKSGATLVRLDARELQAQLSEALARVESEAATLRELKRGVRKEELAIQEAKVWQAETLLADARNNAKNALTETYTTADDGVHNKVDRFFSNARSNAPQITLTINNPQIKTDLELERVLIENVFSSWQAELSSLNLETILSSAINSAKVYNAQIIKFLDKAAGAVNGAIGGANITQATLDSLRADVAAARNAMNAASSAISTAEGKLISAQASLSIEQNRLALDRAGSDPEKIQAQEARLSQAQSQADLIRAQLAKTRLVAPFSGVITLQDAKKGQLVSANIPVVSLISRDSLKIEAFVPEISIGRIAAGNPATITFDALPGETFEGSVLTINPAEEVIDGVVNFKVTVALQNILSENPRLKSGLTANVNIITATKANVIAVPRYAIQQKDEQFFVSRLKRSSLANIPVAIGLRGTDGIWEITSGLNDGDQILVPSKEVSPK